MKIIIPSAATDRHLLLPQARVIAKFGGMDAHDLIYMPTPSSVVEAQEAADFLRNQGVPVTVAPLETDMPGGWPMACNMHWMHANLWMKVNRPGGPFFWMEPDCLPVARGWADKMAVEYQHLNKPFMGHVVATPEVKNGIVVDLPNDVMMMGCGIYPSGIPDDAIIGPLFNDLAKHGSAHPPEGFDRYLRHVFSRRGIAHSALICDMWKTGEYVQGPDGQITCKALPHNKPRRVREGVIPSEAVVVHGCKDGTLAAILLGEEAPRKDEYSVGPSAAFRELTAGIWPPPEKSLVDQWWEGLPQEKRCEVWNHWEKQFVPQESLEEIKRLQTIPDYSNTPTAESIQARLDKGGYRLSDFAKEHDISPITALDKVRALGFTVKPPGWIQRAQPSSNAPGKTP